MGVCSVTYFSKKTLTNTEHHLQHSEKKSPKASLKQDLQYRPGYSTKMSEKSPISPRCMETARNLELGKQGITEI